MLRKRFIFLSIISVLDDLMPKELAEKEIAHTGLTRLEVVPDMHTRKNRMAELASGFVTLPGGAGTLEEIFEQWIWAQLGLH